MEFRGKLAKQHPYVLGYNMLAFFQADTMACQKYTHFQMQTSFSTPFSFTRHEHGFNFIHLPCFKFVIYFLSIRNHHISDTISQPPRCKHNLEKDGNIHYLLKFSRQHDIIRFKEVRRVRNVAVVTTSCHQIAILNCASPRLYCCHTN